MAIITFVRLICHANDVADSSHWASSIYGKCGWRFDYYNKYYYHSVLYYLLLLVSDKTNNSQTKGWDVGKFVVRWMTRRYLVLI